MLKFSNRKTLRQKGVFKVKIELEAGEVKELLVSMEEVTENLGGLLASIQDNFKFLKEAPGVEAQATVRAVWRLTLTLKIILAKARFAIKDLSSCPEQGSNYE